MQTLEAHYEIVTPMFIGGADQHDEPEIRPPSIKGALRFWWRALHWETCLREQGNNLNKAFAALYQQEAALFGAAARDDQYGQGKITLKVRLDNNQERLKTSKNQSLPDADPGQAYLLGQGIYHFKNKFLRDAISPQQSFKVILKLQDKVEAKGVINTLLAFGLLGGLGSRSRKGWGSIAIRSLIHTDKDRNQHSIAVPTDNDSYKKCLSQIMGSMTETSPPFSAISGDTRIDISLHAEKPLQILSSIGTEMQRYRSYGTKKGADSEHKVNGKPAEQNFKADHDLVLAFAKGERISSHPKRLIFGLPHNYFYSNGTKVDIDAINDPDINKKDKPKPNRRASPLLIHVHQFASGQTIGVHCLLKSTFLPEHERIQLKSKAKAQSVNCDVDWAVINTYLDRFSQRERIL